MNKRTGYLVLVLALIVMMLGGGCAKKAETVKETELTVNTSAVEKRDLAQNMTYSGQVRSVNEVPVMAKVSSRVTAILVKPGDRVAPGQTLIALDTSDYQAALAQAQAGVAVAAAGKRAADSKLASARADYERTRKLHDAGAVSDQELQKAQTAYESEAAGAADANLQQAQAGLSMAQANFDKCSIVSPINGMVGSINVSLGDTTGLSSPVAAVTDSAQLEISIMVGEDDISYIKVGSPVRVIIKAGGEAEYTGQVSTVASVPDPVKRNYAVKITLANKDGQIKSGMFAEVKVDTLSKSDILVVPVAAVIPKEGRTVVYTVDADKKAREVEVTTGIKNDQYIEIVKGLQAGQQVITKGNTLVNDGTLVKAVAGGAQ